MSENHRGIGSEGLEQGGPNLGNDYGRKDLNVGNAGDALANAKPAMSATKEEEEDLAIDQESSRNLSPDAGDTDAAGDELVEEDFDDEEEEEDLEDLDDADEPESELERGI